MLDFSRARPRPLVPPLSHLLLPFLTALGFLAGCGSSEGSDPAAGGAASSGGSASGGSVAAGSGGAAAGAASGALEYSPCASTELVGGFRIQLAAAYTGVNGSVRNGTVPNDVPEVVSEASDCRLLAQPNLFCDPPCGSGMTCAAGGACIAYPVSQDVGVVTVTGLNGELTMNPSATGSYTNPAQPPLPHPGFNEGASIELQAAGGVLEPFTLRGVGVAALEVADAAIVAQAGQPLNVTWVVAQDPPAAQRVHIKIEFNRHGGTPTWLDCTAQDTGSFTIPAGIVDELLALEVSGWPTLTATRRSLDSTDLSVGCVELQVLSQAVRELEVEGVVSCDDGHPCPDAQECQANLTCP